MDNLWITEDCASRTVKNAQEVWNVALERIRGDVPLESFELWFKPLRAVAWEDGTLLLEVPNKFFSDWIRDRYLGRIETLVSEAAGSPSGLKFQVARKLQEDPSATFLPEPEPPAVPEAGERTEDPFDPRYTFDTFVIGPANRFAEAAAQSVSNSPGKHYNPLFLYGPAGVGKTHLLHAIGHQLLHKRPRFRVLYASAETLVNDLVEMLKDNQPGRFRQKYRAADALLIDDVQFLAQGDKAVSKEEFFHTFNAVFDAKKQIVLTSDRPPKDLGIEERLRSRFEMGLITGIQPPDLETRMAILKKKAEREKLFVPDDVIVFIASQIKSSVRRLEGALNQLCAHAILMGEALTVDRAREVLRNIITSDEQMPSPIPVDRIIEVVARTSQVDVKEIRGKHKTARLVNARHVAMYLARHMTELSTPEIGRAFGKDHSSVMYACEKIKREVATHPQMGQWITKLMEEIKESDGQTKNL